jgi:hypothetical protein
VKQGIISQAFVPAVERVRMIVDLFDKFKILARVQLEYPKLFSLKFSLYRYALVFGITSKIRYNKADYYMTFGDYEEKPLEELYAKIRTSIDDHKAGIVLIFQSSKNKYHFIAPKLLTSFAESIHISHELGSHKEYLNYSSLKNRMALRLTRKHHKDEPKLIGCIFGTKLDKEAMVSADFVRLMEINYKFGRHNFDNFKIIETPLEFTKYETMNL